MKTRPKRPPIPPERHETIRRQIEAILEGDTLSARDISVEVGISEKDVYDHLEHIHKSVDREGGRLIVTLAECKECGFVFRKRGGLKSPANALSATASRLQSRCLRLLLNFSFRGTMAAQDQPQASSLINPARIGWSCPCHPWPWPDD